MARAYVVFPDPGRPHNKCRHMLDMGALLVTVIVQLQQIDYIFLVFSEPVKVVYRNRNAKIKGLGLDWLSFWAAPQGGTEPGGICTHFLRGTQF